MKHKKKTKRFLRELIEGIKDKGHRVNLIDHATLYKASRLLTLLTKKKKKK